MKNKKVVSSKNLPARLPVISTLVFWLVLDKLQAPGWIWGVVGTVMVIGWVGAIVEICNREDVEIFKDKESA